MTIQTLVVTVDQRDALIAGRMNIQTDAIIGNQADFAGEERLTVNGHEVLFLTEHDRGVGRNRNRILERASAELCVFADDDMCFVDGYPELVARAFRECPEADVIVFNLIEKEPRRYVNRRVFPVTYINYARYGAARMAMRRQRVVDSGIRFSLLFGGGAKYGSGEDTIFLHECLKRGLKIVAVPYALAEIDQEADSTWFHGYDGKFFRDKGALYACLHDRTATLFCARYLVKYRGKYRKAYPARRAWRDMRSGIADYEKTAEEARQ